MTIVGHQRPVGRSVELARMSAVLDAARAGTSSALVLLGEAGIGKTALLNDAVVAAGEMQILRARGIESESGVPFGVLVELLRPVQSFIESIPPGLAESLRGALELGPAAPTPPPLRIGVALLSVLAAAADEQPLLMVVDDAHWADEASIGALLFAARRLGAEGIAALFAVREGEPRVPDTSGIPELWVGGLDVGSARELMTEADVSDDVLTRLHAAVRGNPLALIEGVGLLGEDQRRGLAPLPELLRAGERIERAFSRRIGSLGPEGRRAVVIAAAANGSHAGEVAAALRDQGLTLGVLSEAETAGIVALRDGRVEFTHPLLRSVAYHSALPSERRAAHRALARALADTAPARSLLQRAAASTEPDEDLASALERVAEDAAGRGAPVEAARTIERAADFSPSKPERTRRLLVASQLAALGAHFSYARTLCDRGLADAGDSPARNSLELLLGVLEIMAGAPRQGEDALIEAARRTEKDDPATAAMMLHWAIVARVMRGDCWAGLALSERAVALTRDGDAFEGLVADSTLQATRILVGDPPEDPSSLFKVHEQLAQAPTQQVRPEVAPFMLPQQLRWIERYDEAARILRESIAAARGQTAPLSLPYYLASLAEVELAHGDLTGAYADAEDGLRLCRDTGMGSHAGFTLVTLARVEALQGREQACRDHMTEAGAIERSSESRSLRTYIGAGLGMLEVALGRPKAAILELLPVAELTSTSGLEHPGVVPWQPELIEAYARTGRRAEALRELELFERRAERSRCTWAAAAALRYRGLLAPSDAFDEPFAQALALHATQPLPIERARTELCHGERLRGAGRRREAQEHLRRAVDIFERSGAHLWAAPARAELSAAGGRDDARLASGELDLTPHELQVAREVAAGATNAEAAARLFISPKTVEKHLTSAYRKLGVRSRTELAARFAAAGPDTGFAG